MKTSDSSREAILKRIKTARNGRSYFRSIEAENSSCIYKPVAPDRLTCFKTELEAVSGECIICSSTEELAARLKDFMSSRALPSLFCRDGSLKRLLTDNDIACSSSSEDFENMQAGITTCEFLIARTGTAVVSSASPSGRQMHIFPPIHIVIARQQQLVDYVEDGLAAMLEKYENGLPAAITCITGPSRTADIEKTLVLGAHGPKEMVVFILKN